MKGEKRFKTFWAETFEGWFARWPMEPLTEEEKLAGVNEEERMKAMKQVREPTGHDVLSQLTRTKRKSNSGTIITVEGQKLASDGKC